MTDRQSGGWRDRGKYPHGKYPNRPGDILLTGTIIMMIVFLVLAILKAVG